jgi:hypothetical protein
MSTVAALLYGKNTNASSDLYSAVISNEQMQVKSTIRTRHRALAADRRLVTRSQYLYSLNDAKCGLAARTGYNKHIQHRADNPGMQGGPQRGVKRVHTHNGRRERRRDWKFF